MGYRTYVVFALLLVLAPGPDVAVVLKNALLGGRRRGLVTALHGLREWLRRRPVRRALDAITGAVLLSFGARLATE